MPLVWGGSTNPARVTIVGHGGDERPEGGETNGVRTAARVLAVADRDDTGKVAGQ